MRPNKGGGEKGRKRKKGVGGERPIQGIKEKKGEAEGIKAGGWQRGGDGRDWKIKM